VERDLPSVQGRLSPFESHDGRILFFPFVWESRWRTAEPVDASGAMAGPTATMAGCRHLPAHTRCFAATARARYHWDAESTGAKPRFKHRAI
jgi:hypothetical protein